MITAIEIVARHAASFVYTHFDVISPMLVELELPPSAAQGLAQWRSVYGTIERMRYGARGGAG